MYYHISNFQYFNMMSALTWKKSTDWADNIIYIKIILKLSKAFLDRNKKLEILKYKWNNPKTDLRTRIKLTKKINKTQEEMCILFTEQEILFLKNLDESADLDIKIIH